MQIFSDLLEAEQYEIDTDLIDNLYNRVISGLQLSAESSVPRCHKNFLIFLCNQEPSEVKERSIVSSNLWKEAGRPRSGPVFNRYRSDKSVYKLTIRRQQHEYTVTYTNYLHDAVGVSHRIFVLLSLIHI